MEHSGVGGRGAGSGGHGWPGGPQYLSVRVIGRVPWHLDASKILLDMVAAGS
jgi:hypothetical protein